MITVKKCLVYVVIEDETDNKKVANALIHEESGMFLEVEGPSVPFHNELEQLSEDDMPRSFRE